MILGNKHWLDNYSLTNDTSRSNWSDLGTLPIKDTSGNRLSMTGTSVFYYFTYLNSVGNDILPQTSDITIASSDGCDWGVLDIVIGEGTRAPTVSDYQLQTQLFENLRSSNTSKNFNQDGGYVTRLFQYYGENPITINEIGLITRLSTDRIYGRSANYTAIPVLLTRSVLTTPRIIQKNEYFTVTIHI